MDKQGDRWLFISHISVSPISMKGKIIWYSFFKINSWSSFLTPCDINLMHSLRMYVNANKQAFRAHLVTGEESMRIQQSWRFLTTPRKKIPHQGFQIDINAYHKYS